MLDSRNGPPLRRLIEDSADLFCALDGDGVITDANAAWRRRLGWSAADVIGRRLADLTHPDDAASGESGMSFRSRCREKTGGYRWIDWRAESPGDADGVCLLGRELAAERLPDAGPPERLDREARRSLGGTDDVGAARRRGAFLEARNRRLDELLSESASVVYAYDPKTDVYSFLAAGFEALTGVPAGDLVTGAATWRDIVLEEDAAGLTATVTAWLKAGAAAPLVTQFRIRRADGAERWIEDRARYLRRGDGHPDEIVGSLTDVTERIERERAVADSQAKLAATIAALPDLLFEADADGRILDMNLGADNVVVLPPERIVGRTLHEAFPPDVARIGHDALREAERKGVSRGHVFPLAAEGVMRWYELSVSRKAVAAGEPARFVALSRDITDSRRLAEKLERERALFRQVFENSPAMMFLKRRDGRFVAANAAFSAMWARDTVDGLLGPDFVDSEEAARQERNDAEAFETGKPSIREDVWTTALGPRHVLCARFLAPDPESGEDLLCCVTVDITEQKRRETEAALAHDQLEAVLDNADVAIFLKDRDGRFVYANPVMCAQWGVDSLVGLTTDDAAPPAVAAALKADDERVLASGERSSQEVSVRFADGLEHSLVVSRFVVPDARTGEPLLCGLGADVTEIKRLQVEAEAANRAKAQFLAVMSHELRTPMNGVIGMADLMAKTTLDAEQTRMLDVIRESGESLLAIINDVLDFSRLEAGRMAFEAAAFEPAAVARRVQRIMGPRAEERGVAVAFEIAPEAALARIGDAHRVEQILLNLMSNAVKFAENGHAVLRMDGRRGAPLTIVVEDDGIGMTAAQVARVFERFTQADASMSRRFGGAGLGLSIVRGLVDAMGGAIDVTSAPGAGARFTVTLPLPEAEAETPAETVEPEALRLPPGLRVLAADDNEINRLVLSAMLDALEVRRLCVDGGGAAVAAAKSEAIDLILLDISMPDMDGVEALAAIRADEAARGAARRPAVAVTANALPEQVAAYLAAGFDAHLAKPIRQDALAAALMRWSAVAAS
jgi:PAS domain S-box-containing protein